MSTIPTVPLKFPLEGKPVDGSGNWTPTWHHAMQGLFTRVGSNTAPSNTALANAIATSVQGPVGATDGDIAVFSGTTGYVIKDSGIQASGLVTGPATSTDSHITLFNGATGKIIKDSGVLLSSLATTSAISQLITGPATSVVGDIATFNNTTGTLAADSGILASSLAPKASPTFTGTPVAPTATSGTNTTQVATTAFVTTAVAAAGLTASSFSTHNNGVSQSIPNNTFTKLTFSTVVFNVGSNLSGSTWTPPAGRPILLTGAVLFPSTLNTLTTVAVYKNGAEYKRGSMIPAGGVNATVASVSCIDIPNGTDVYELWAFQNTGAAQNTTGTSTVTYFQGTSIQA